jgi:hypothetical protein
MKQQLMHELKAMTLRQSKAQHSTDRSCYWDLADARGSFWTEIKRNVFKRVRKENLHNLVLYTMTSLRDFTSRPFCYLFLLKVSWKQRVHGLTAFLLITRHWFFLCEVLIDAIKHSFLAKFNEIKPVAYSEFLEALKLLRVI